MKRLKQNEIEIYNLERKNFKEGDKNIYVEEQPEEKMILDLGKVADLAEVYVNGEFCGTAWKEPYTVDITKALKAGVNTLEVKVANVWVNRLIGDEQPGAIRIGWTDSRGFNGNEQLLSAGLLGPVKIVSY